MKSSKAKAQALSHRSVEILGILADALPDPSDIPPAMLANINRFEKYVFDINTKAVLTSHGFCLRLLLEIHDAMKPSTKQRPLKSLLHLNRNEDTLSDFHRRLDEACQNFLVFCLVVFAYPALSGFCFIRLEV